MNYLEVPRCTELNSPAILLFFPREIPGSAPQRLGVIRDKRFIPSSLTNITKRILPISNMQYDFPQKVISVRFMSKVRIANEIV